MNEPVNFSPLTGNRYEPSAFIGGFAPTLAELRQHGAPWSFDPWTGKPRSFAAIESDPRMELEYPTPGPTTLTLGQVRQLHLDLQADILALIQQFERNTGATVADVDTCSVGVTTIESQGMERRTSQVRVSVVL